jgi:hypothetical protein
MVTTNQPIRDIARMCQIPRKECGVSLSQIKHNLDSSWAPEVYSSPTAGRSEASINSITREERNEGLRGDYQCHSRLHPRVRRTGIVPTKPMW